MLTKAQAFDILVSTIAKNKEHPDYKRVCALAKKYRDMISGENMDDYLKQFNLREDDTLFKQRVRLTNLVVSCITGTLITPEKKVPAVKPITKTFEYKSPTGDKKRRDELDRAIEKFYGGQGIDNYLNDVYMNLFDSDPNAFVLFLFNNFNNKVEKPIVYATQIACEDAIDYEYIDNTLQYLTVRKAIQYELVKRTGKNEVKYKEGKYYTIYPGNDQIEFTQVDVELLQGLIPEGVLLKVVDGSVESITIDNAKPQQKESVVKYYYKFSKAVLYEVGFFEPKAKRVPAFRVGNIPDVTTDGRTCVNGWHRAMPYLLKSIKICSELDLTTSLHNFPQKFEYQPRCMGAVVDKNPIGCNLGQTPDGKTCTACGGSGWASHNSAQDVIRLAMPRNKDDIIDITKLAHYLQLPVEGVKLMMEYMDRIEEKAIRAVYNSDRFTKTTFSNTATQNLIDLQSVYDALTPLSQRYSYAYTFSVQQVANYTDLEKDLVIKHLFPKNFKFETLESLIARLKAARDAGVNDYTLSYMDYEITETTFIDQPDVLKEIKVKGSFYPFSGKTEQAILSLISSGLVTEHNKVLYSEFNAIFSELEQDFSTTKKDDTEIISFYDLTHEAQKKLVDAKVKAFAEKLKQENPPPVINTSSFFAPAQASAN